MIDTSRRFICQAARVTYQGRVLKVNPNSPT